MMCGGVGGIKTEIDEEFMQEFLEFKPTIETKLGLTFTSFKPLAYTSQVVAGAIFQIKYETDQGHVHAKCFRPLPHTGE